VLEGLLTFADRPKSDAGASIAELERLGVEVKIITGDNGLVAAKVCSDIGLECAGVLSGPEVRALDDDHLEAAILITTVFARIGPDEKSRIIKVARRTGKDVAFLGDGVNDAVALHHADVGISVDSATDVAKDAADVVLLDKDLGVLAEGLMEGRRIFANTMKFFRVTEEPEGGRPFTLAATIERRLMSVATAPPASGRSVPVDQSMSSRNKEKAHALGLTSATGLVVGSIVGTGVFTMPAVMAGAGTMSLVVLGVIAVGALLLGVLFGQLTKRIPNSDGGVYAYSRHEFGDFAGYLVGWCYWIQAWAGNAAIVASWVFYVDALCGINHASGMENWGIALFGLWVPAIVNLVGFAKWPGFRILLSSSSSFPFCSLAWSDGSSSGP
jgi:3-deoxy-D-manno-octulosonate 8-phosphate phosphatase KdsC-like HAD superfamily phosphatase